MYNTKRLKAVVETCVSGSFDKNPPQAEERFDMATNKVVVEGASVTGPQWKELVRQIVDGELTNSQVQAIIERRSPFGDDALPDLDWSTVYEALGWTTVYGAFGMSAEYEEFAKANTSKFARPGLWTVPILKGITPNKVITAFRKLDVSVYLYTNDLDADVTKNDRDPNRDGSYVVIFKKTVEADPDQKDKSADMLKAEGVQGITLLERLLLELGYFLATRKHLDNENWTLCSGSRYSDGGVLSVCRDRDGRRLCVGWYNPGSHAANLRSRSVQQ